MIGQVNHELGLNEKFSEVCDRIKKILTDQSLLHSWESTAMNVALVLKIAGDIVFASKGGLPINMILKYCNCTLDELSTKLEKVRPYSQVILQEVM
jgi:hypothetical protein